ILAPGPIPAHLLPLAERAVEDCPVLALALRRTERKKSTAVLGIADDRALGGSMRVIVTRPQSLVAAKAAVDEVIREIDIAASRFRGDSELCRLNAMPDKVIKVSPLLAQAIETGLRGAELTEGAVDPTIGYAIVVNGYDADFSSVAPQGAA